MAEEHNEPGGIFHDVTPMSVVAPALAAATSFALMSRVGLVGSLVGTAVTAAVTAAATQVYKNMMAASAERLRQLAPGADGTGDADMRMSTGAAGQEPADGMGMAGHEAADGMGNQAPPHASNDELEATVVRPTPTGVTPPGEAAETSVLTAACTTPADGRARRAALQQTQQARWKVALFSAVFACVVALIVAGIILAVTAGQGLGPTTVIVRTPAEEGAATGGDTVDVSTQDDAAETVTPTTTDDGSGSDADGSETTDDATTDADAGVTGEGADGTAPSDVTDGNGDTGTQTDTTVETDADRPTGDTGADSTTGGAAADGGTTG